VWSPEGRTILFEQFVGDPFEESKLMDLYIINPDGSGKRRLMRVRNEVDHCACAVWSPDGTKIAYEAEGTRGRPDIYVMNADGSEDDQPGAAAPAPVVAVTIPAPFPGETASAEEDAEDEVVRGARATTT